LFKEKKLFLAVRSGSRLSHQTKLELFLRVYSLKKYLFLSQKDRKNTISTITDFKASKVKKLNAVGIKCWSISLHLDPDPGYINARCMKIQIRSAADPYPGSGAFLTPRSGLQAG
jgi:hypothetical protein